MTEKSASDELRRLLDEAGVEWHETVNHANCTFTWWESPLFGMVFAMDNEDGETLFMACLNSCDFTPEQAIAVTLGNSKPTADAIAELRNVVREAFGGESMSILVEGHAIMRAIDAVEAAALGGGECELEEVDAYDSAGGSVRVLECSACGETCEHVNGSYPRCPHCGRKAVER